MKQLALNSLTFLYLSFLIFNTISCSSLPDSKSKKKVLMIGTYNVENLFDTVDDPKTKDEEFLPEGRKNWTKERYEIKLAHLAKVILAMNNGKGPDILGLVEVENKQVIEDLIQTEGMKKQNYSIVHSESSDIRGIDCALIYKEKVFSVIQSKAYPVEMENEPNYITRDVLWVNGEFNNCEKAHFLINHWPSRRGGLATSAPRRASAARTARAICDDILKQNPKANIFVLGDFNDEPNNESISDILRARSTYNSNFSSDLYNPFYSINDSITGSYKYRSFWNMLDQVIVSSATIQEKTKVKYIENSAKVFAEPWMRETNPKYIDAPLRTFGGNKYLEGYSDHFPVYILVKIL